MNILHLDLEGTVIKHYDNPELINIQKVQEFIEKLNPSEIHIFSHALYDNKVLDDFSLHIQPSLERALNIKLSYIPTVENIIEAISHIEPTRPDDVIEYIRHTSKTKSFFNYCKSFEYIANHYLVDDCVAQELMINKTDLQICETVPVHLIESWQPLLLSYEMPKKHKIKLP